MDCNRGAGTQPTELEAKLAHLAAQQQRDTNELVQDALARYVEDETRFLESVEKGTALTGSR